MIRDKYLSLHDPKIHLSLSSRQPNFNVGQPFEMTGSEPLSYAKSLTQDDALLVLEQADLATRAQVPLPPGLRAMAAETRSPRLRRALRSMADRLEAGEDLPTVIQSLQPRLTRLMSTLIEEGSHVGRLDTILHWAVEQGRRTQRLRWQLWSSLAYPLVLTDVAVVIVAIVLFGIAPMFNQVFVDFGTRLPDLTQIILNVANFGARHRYWVWALVVQAMILVIVVPTILMGERTMRQRWAGAIPVLGPLFRLAALSDFCHLLAVFVEVQMPMAKAVRLTGQAINDMWLQVACDDLAREIEQGLSSQSSAMAAGLPAAIAQMLRDSSSASTLVEALQGLGDIYAARASTNSRFIAVIIEPFILVFTAASIGTIVVALYLPLINLLNMLA